MKRILKTFIFITLFSLFLPYNASAEIIDTYVLRGLSRNIVYFDAYPGGNPPCTPGGGDIFLNYGTLDNTVVINASTIYTTVTPYLTSPNPPTRAIF